MHIIRRCKLGVFAAVGLISISAAEAHAQVSKVYEQFYLPAEHNWAFRNNYPGADRLFNAFDYGHAILYEILWTRPNAPESILEQKSYDFITKKLLVNPPRMPLEEAAIEVAYARLAPEAKMMFDWAHLLHRQVYDVWADESIAFDKKDAKIAEIIRYYKSRPDLAFSSKPKDMELMEGQYYSKDFRTRYPKFNGLIWAYHWLQVGLYEPLVSAANQAERQTGVTAAVTRFREMLEEAPQYMPTVMPMTAAIAPEFARRYPEAAIIFDNLHGMHDVISDILSSPKVAKQDKRKEILEAARRYRDDTSFVMTQDEWREMSVAMGVGNMGGSAAIDQPMPSATTTPQSNGHAGHMSQFPPAAPDTPVDPPSSTPEQVLLRAMFADSLIRSRAESDSALVRLMNEADFTLPHEDMGSDPDAATTELEASHEHTRPEAVKPNPGLPKASEKKTSVHKPGAKPVAKPGATPAKVAKPPAKPAPKRTAPADHTDH